MTSQRTYSTLDLEKYLAGALDADRSNAIERALEEDRELKAWIDLRRAERQEFLLDPRRKRFALLLAEAKVPERRFMPRVWMLVMPAAALVVASLFLHLPVQDQSEFGVKGGLSLKAAVLEGDRAQLYDGEELHPGNRLRLSIDDPKGGFVTVILEESSGELSVAYRPDEMGRLGPGSHHLPGSLELDGDLGRERLYVLVSEERPNVDRWLEELEAARAKDGFLHGWLPEGTTRVSTIEYEKVK